MPAAPQQPARTATPTVSTTRRNSDLATLAGQTNISRGGEDRCDMVITLPRRALPAASPPVSFHPDARSSRKVSGSSERAPGRSRWRITARCHECEGLRSRRTVLRR